MDLQTSGAVRLFRAYAHPKHAIHAFVLELDRRARAAGASVSAVLAHPGYAIDRPQPRSGRASLSPRRLPGWAPRRSASRRRARTAVRPPSAGRSSTTGRRWRVRRPCPAHPRSSGAATPRRLERLARVRGYRAGAGRALVRRPLRRLSRLSRPRLCAELPLTVVCPHLFSLLLERRQFTDAIRLTGARGGA